MKRFLIILAVILLAGTGYFTYDKWAKEADFSIWSFVPGNTILIYETSKPLSIFDEVKESNVWKNLSQLPSIADIETSIQTLDTLAGKGNFRKFFENNNSLISINITSSKELDFLFIVEISSLSQQTYISKAQAYFRDSGYKKRTREYLDFTITELVDPKTNKSFTYIFYKNFFIGSYTAFLVEDAIRTISENGVNGFDKRNPELKKLAKLEKDQGNVYFNQSRLPSFLNIFSEENTELNLAKSSFLDLKINEDVINLTGFTFIDEPTHLLSNFQSTQGGSFDMAEIIPNETSWLYHITSSKPVELGNSLNTYYQIASPLAIQKQKELLADVDFDVNYTYSLIDQEIALITLESSVTGDHNKLMILEIKDIGEALKYFNSVGERVALKTQDSVYIERYADYQIRKLPATDFPYALLGPLGAGFDQIYYLQFRNYLVFSNHLQQLKNFTISIENENTWNKSIRINRFLDQTNKEANFSLYVNTPRAWNQVVSSLKSPWKEHASEYQSVYKNLEFLAFQFSAVDNKFYTNMTAYQPNLPKKVVPEQIEPQKSISFPNSIITKPWLVVNHNTRKREIFVQDESNVVYLVSENFEVLWNVQLDDRINSEIKQMDYYKNGKLQIVFTTPSAIHIIDRTGEYIPEFPKKLPGDYQIEHFSLIDYNNTRDYRFGLADTKGNVYLTDKNVKPQGEWSPLKFSQPLLMAPMHVRIAAKDVIVCIQKDGKITLLNRRAEPYKGFPLELEKDLSERVFINNNNSFGGSSIAMVSKDGELFNLSFDGKILKREQLYKPGTETVFSIMEDVTGDSYLILRNTENQYEVLNANGELLFQKDYLTTQTLYNQYYQLGGGIEFIIFTDPQGSYLYIYDRQGKLITGRPLVGTQPVSIMRFDNEFQVYRADNQDLELISISY